MKFITKTEINSILKEAGLEFIYRGFNRRKNYHNPPKYYVKYDGKKIKGLNLYRTSPVTFTSVAFDNAVTEVTLLFSKLMQRALTGKKLGSLSFIVVFQIGKNSALVLKGIKNDAPDCEYDGTYHYLHIYSNVIKLDKVFEEVNENGPTLDNPGKIHNLSSEYLDKILQNS